MKTCWCVAEYKDHIEFEVNLKNSNEFKTIRLCPDSIFREKVSYSHLMFARPKVKNNA